MRAKAKTVLLITGAFLFSLRNAHALSDPNCDQGKIILKGGPSLTIPKNLEGGQSALYCLSPGPQGWQPCLRQDYLNKAKMDPGAEPICLLSFGATEALIPDQVIVDVDQNPEKFVYAPNMPQDTLKPDYAAMVSRMKTVRATKNNALSNTDFNGDSSRMDVDFRKVFVDALNYQKYDVSLSCLDDSKEFNIESRTTIRTTRRSVNGGTIDVFRLSREPTYDDCQLSPQGFADAELTCLTQDKSKLMTMLSVHDVPNECIPNDQPQRMPIVWQCNLDSFTTANECARHGLDVLKSYAGCQFDETTVTSFKTHYRWGASAVSTNCIQPVNKTCPYAYQQDLFPSAISNSDSFHIEDNLVCVAQK